jgi:hypothetical protein
MSIPYSGEGKLVWIIKYADVRSKSMGKLILLMLSILTMTIGCKNIGKNTIDDEFDATFADKKSMEKINDLQKELKAIGNEISKHNTETNYIKTIMMDDYPDVIREVHIYVNNYADQELMKDIFGHSKPILDKRSYSTSEYPKIMIIGDSKINLTVMPDFYIGKYYGQIEKEYYDKLIDFIFTIPGADAYF